MELKPRRDNDINLKMGTENTDREEEEMSLSSDHRQFFPIHYVDRSQYLIPMKRTTYFTLVILTLVLASCVVSKPDSKETKEGLASLEQRAEASQSVLLIEKVTGLYHNIYNKRRMNDCKQFYKVGQVEAADFKLVANDQKYQDMKLYRYMLVDGSTSQDFSYLSANGGSHTNTHVITNYFLFDRLTGEKFDLNVRGVNPDRVFKKAVQKLNAHMMGNTKK
jgi:hypothetical protein